MPDNRPAVYTEGDTVFYRASALGGCLRALFAARSNMERMPIPSVIQAGMDEGTNLEPTILDLLRDRHGWYLTDRHPSTPPDGQYVVTLTVSDNIIVRGALDGVGRPPGEPASFGPIDVKAFTPEQCSLFHNKGFDAFPRYAWQQSVYAYGYIHSHLDLTPIFYMPIFNKGTWQIEPWSLVPYKPMFTLADIARRIATVEQYFARAELPPNCPQDYACQYPYLHDGPSKTAIPDNLTLIAQGRIKLSNKIKVFEEARKTLDEALKSTLDSSLTYTIDGYTVSIYANPSRFNTNEAKRILREMEVDIDSLTIPGQGTQIRFTPPKGDKGNE